MWGLRIGHLALAALLGTASCSDPAGTLDAEGPDGQSPIQGLVLAVSDTGDFEDVPLEAGAVIAVAFDDSGPLWEWLEVGYPIERGNVTGAYATIPVDKFDREDVPASVFRLDGGSFSGAVGEDVDLFCVVTFEGETAWLSGCRFAEVTGPSTITLRVGDGLGISVESG